MSFVAAPPVIFTMNTPYPPIPRRRPDATPTSTSSNLNHDRVVVWLLVGMIINLCMVMLMARTLDNENCYMMALCCFAMQTELTFLLHSRKGRRFFSERRRILTHIFLFDTWAMACAGLWFSHLKVVPMGAVWFIAIPAGQSIVLHIWVRIEFDWTDEGDSQERPQQSVQDRRDATTAVRNAGLGARDRADRDARLATRESRVTLRDATQGLFHAYEAMHLGGYSGFA